MTEIEQHIEVLTDYIGKVWSLEDLEIAMHRHFYNAVESGLNALKKQTPLRFKTEHICPACNAHNETIKRRMATVPKDVCYCWHCGQAIEFGGNENE